jgi:ribonuclease HI
MPHRAKCILDALLRSDSGNAVWETELDRLRREPAWALQPLLERAEAEYQEAASLNRRARKDAWFKWVAEALDDGGGRLYRWIRGGAVSGAAMVPDPTESGEDANVGSRSWILALRGGAATQLRTLELHWKKLWQRQYNLPVPEEWLAELDALPPFPARTKWTVDGIRDILKRMAKRKAAGLEGWTVAELRLLPDELLGMVALLFEAVEARGRWPTQLCAPEGLLLPKGGASEVGDPMDRRPIWLLPMLYRVWAAGRAQLFAEWRSSWPDGDGGFGAEELAWELALDLEAAEAAGEDICGAALDWRKAFDNIPLCNLDTLLRRAGLPDWLRGPVVAAYSAPRRLRVEGAVGSTWRPSSGILPGCALAVFVLSVLIRPWDRKAMRVHDLLRRRIYVDDLVFWARGDANEVAPAITEGLELTKQFEQAMGWRLHTGRGKSSQFANTAKVRAWLKEQAVEFEVKTHVKDLGVVATAGPRARAPVSAGRMATASARMKRVGRIPVPFNRRCKLAAAAGTAAGMYGAACGGPPARELDALRRAARTAVCHGGCRAAPEIVFGLLSPTWRLDPKAVTIIAPIWQAVKAIRGERLRLEDWENTACAIRAGRGRRVGPVAAALCGMARLGLGSDIAKWSGVPGAPHGWVAADHTKEESLTVLLQSWRSAEWRELAARRADFSHLCDGVDTWATMRLLSGGVKGCPKLQPDAAGALRTVISGNVVTERVAAHWTSRPLCPHCGLEVEDHEHRFWRCPRWENARTAALGAPAEALILRRTLGDGVARTGVLASQPALMALAQTARVEPMQFPVVGLQSADAVEGSSGSRRKVWSDGSCLHPLDPLLARAAWGIRVQGVGGGEPRDFAGPVGGDQTAQRAEVAAALAAARAVDQPIELVSDSRWVVRSIAALAAGACPAEWRHADLWEQLRPYIKQGRVVARWTPAHKDAEEYARRGLMEEDRLGNDAADNNAKAAALTRMPPSAIVEQRVLQLNSLADAQRVIAFTELAALRANHGNGTGSAPRIKRRWADVRRGARAAQRANADAPIDPCAAATNDRPDGEPPAPLHRLTRSGETLECSVCKKTAVKARWTALAYGSCAFNTDEAHWLWRRVPHLVSVDDGQVSCARCNGTVPLGRRSAFEGKRCPAWLAEAPETITDAPDWGAWFYKLMGHSAAGVRVRSRLHGPSTGGGEAEAQRPAASRQAGVQALFNGTAWRPHAGAQGPSFVACITCGGIAGDWTQLQATSCGGWRVVLPPRVAALVLLGDNISRAGGPPTGFVAALAARRGERPRPPE